MEGISCEYLSHTGSDNAIANVARVSFAGGENWDELPEGYSEEKSEKLIKYLAKHEHTSPFRHNAIVIRCKAPIFLARQLMKHQVGMSWNEVSRRYVDSVPEFFSPESWRSRPEGSLKQGSGEEAVEDFAWFNHTKCELDHCEPQQAYRKTVEMCLSLYNDMLDAKIAPELARMVLPQSMVTEWVWTGSLMAFAHTYNLRIKENAQVEAQEFAKELDRIIRPLFPVAWECLTSK